MFNQYKFLKKLTVENKSLSYWGNLFVNYMKSNNLEFDPGHRIDHVMRVTHTALRLAESENAKFEIVLPAVILHDSLPISKFDKDRQRASKLSAEHSIKLLREWGYAEEFLNPIEHAILVHSFSANIKAETLEAKIVQDADRLDAIGCIGIARTMAVGFAHGNPLYNFENPFPLGREPDDHNNILDHFYQKLLTLPDTLHTKAAKCDAKIRIQRMEIFLQGLADEIGTKYVSISNLESEAS